MSYVQFIYEDEDGNRLTDEEVSSLAPVLITQINKTDFRNEDENAEEMHVESEAHNADIPIQDPLNNSRVSKEGNEWGKRETNFLLRKYNKYIPDIGFKKRFRTKKEMWTQISRDMKDEIDVEKSCFQCENRYKTVLRRWRNNVAKQNPANVSSETSFKSVKKPVKLLPNASTSNLGERKKDLASVLWDIFEKKEEGRQKRHKEKMELMRKIAFEIVK